MATRCRGVDMSEDSAVARDWSDVSMDETQKPASRDETDRPTRTCGRTRLCALSETAYRTLRATYWPGDDSDTTSEVAVAQDTSIRLHRVTLDGREEYTLELCLTGVPSLADVLVDGEWREIPENLRTIDSNADSNQVRIDALRGTIERVELPHRHLACAGYATVSFASNVQPADAARHLEPYISIERSSTEPLDIVEIVDHETYEAARQVHQFFEWQAWSRLRGHPRRGPAGDGFSFFRVDDQIVGAFRMPAYRDPGQIFYLRTSPHAPWHMIRHPEVTRSRYALARMVRTIAAAKGQKAGVMCLHASAFVADDGAYALCGDEGAGKTTNLLTALSVVGARLLSNDRVFIRAEHGRAIAYGYPHAIPVRAGTARAYRHLQSALARDPNAASSIASVFDHVARDRASSNTAIRGEASRFFTAIELANRFGTSVCTGAPLAGIIMLDSARRVTRPMWTRISGVDLAVRLHEHLHQQFCNAQTFWTELLDGGRPGISRAVAGAIEKTPVYSLNSWHRLPEAWQEFKTLTIDGPTTSGHGIH